MKMHKLCKHAIGKNMPTCKGPNYANMERRNLCKHVKVQITERCKLCKHGKAQNMQTWNGAKHENMQRRKLCKHANDANYANMAIGAKNMPTRKAQTTQT